MNMPMVGLGTGFSTKEKAERAVEAAIDVGVRLIDTSTLYGNEEATIGKVLAKYINTGKAMVLKLV